MAFTNRWAIRDVATASFYDLVTGDLKVRLNSLTMSSIENSSVVVYAVGGSGAPKVVGFSGTRAAKFTLQDCLFTNDMIGIMTGNPVITGATPVIQSDTLTVGTNAATLNFTPNASGAILSLNRLNVDGTLGAKLSYVPSAPAANQYSITGKALSFFAGDLTSGSSIFATYNTLSGTDTKQIKVSTNKFAGSYKLVLDVLVTDFYLKSLFSAQIVVPTAKIEDTFKLEMKMDGAPSLFDIPMEALKSANSTDFYTMNIFDSAELA